MPSSTLHQFILYTFLLPSVTIAYITNPPLSFSARQQLDHTPRHTTILSSTTKGASTHEEDIELTRKVIMANIKFNDDLDLTRDLIMDHIVSNDDDMTIEDDDDEVEEEEEEELVVEMNYEAGPLVENEGEEESETIEPISSEVTA
mmetsp:Transcript_12093/g.15088  ORF Transcript_12093/g.15088 Transcript_12093/m.15088 type:complete len:146 (+) Transcript_12093:99-536(+)|eukprot:CAMPEP_0172505422 /NCGR_PEP_ID=MMETSP1066-20121228/186372_1 /TAXON_ID=671091 /ORGANISM="Coscinodiscus wailesii, Strain CCMP2513" /LENGTH=145 /DNA_ID=CAMNT_0013282025 /DNA_START=96 /DNA_END=533 /DNA_ORIENTATION=-